MAHEVWIGLCELQDEVHAWCVRQGFWEHDDGAHQVDAEKIALMHSELSEALDALRSGDMAHVEEELMDCVWRIADYMGQRGLSMARGNNVVRDKNLARGRLNDRNW
jgi:NTP pyrophosphatase (non-canonical NTP hydrolase)